MPTNPYDWAFSHPDLLLLYTAAGLLLVGWIAWSVPKTLQVYAKVHTGLKAKLHGEALGSEKREQLPAHILELCVVSAVNLVLIGAYIHLVTA